MSLPAHCLDGSPLVPPECLHMKIWIRRDANKPSPYATHGPPIPYASPIPTPPPVWGCGYGWVGWGSFSQTQHEGVYRITASVHCSGTKHINQHGGVGSISKFTKEKKVLRKNCETTRSRQSSIQNQSKSGDCVSPMAWLEGKAIFDQRCRIGSHAFRPVSLFQTFFHTTRSPLSVNVTVIRPQSSLQISTIVFPVTQYKFRHNLALIHDCHGCTMIIIVVKGMVLCGRDIDKNNLYINTYKVLPTFRTGARNLLVLELDLLHSAFFSKKHFCPTSPATIFKRGKFGKFKVAHRAHPRLLVRIGSAVRVHISNQCHTPPDRSGRIVESLWKNNISDKIAFY